MSEPHAAPLACENCQTPLQGHYCHSCGQSAHNPLRSFAHAVEEVFESFWHLDGRIFRTLRDLLVPGRLANAYIEGKRVRFIPPLRLFVVLSLITFFVAKLAVHIDNGKDEDARGQATAQVRGDFDDARTPEEVEALRKRLIDGLVQGREKMPAHIPGARAGFDASIAAIDKQAQRRLKALDAPVTTAPEAQWAASKADEDLGASSDPFQSPMPAFANHWVDRQIKRINDNVPRMQDDPQRFVNAFFAAVPSALFVLVPLFALLLRVFYLLSGRGYLEHLVVALYSHAFLLLDLLAILLLMLLGQALEGWANWPGLVIGLLQFVLLMWMPVYLLLMQQRVYRQFWLVTVVKYGVIGWIYFSVVLTAAVLLVVASFARA